MKTIKENIIVEPFSSKTMQMYFGNSSFAVFDIETTGLNPSYCQMMLSGILKVQGNSGTITQYFAESPKDEKEIIEKTIEEISSVNYVLTYNGRHFDLPFVKKRAEHNNLDTSRLPYTLDLYLILNGYSPFKNFLPNLKQKTVEVFMGLSDSRDDGISGKENIELYEHYIKTRSKDSEAKILLHNHDDLIQLYKLLPVINQTDFHRAMFSLGYPLKNYCITKVYTIGRDLKILAVQTEKAVDYVSFPTEERPYSLVMDSKSRKLELTVPGFSENGFIICDAYAILGDKIEHLKKYPNVVNGYLITSNADGLNHMEINAFIIIFFTEILPNIL